MAINTSVEPFISAMLRQPDAKSIAQGIPRAIQGFAGSYLARKEIEEIENRKPEDQRKSGFERFVGGFVNGPGRIAEGQEPFSVQKRNLNDQVNQILKDPVGLANEIGNLSPDDIPNWVAKNAGFAAHPLGKAMLDTALKAYGETQEMKLKSLDVQRRVVDSLRLLEQSQRPLSQVGKEEYDLEQAIASGDTALADRLRKAIEEKRTSQFADPMIERELRLYADAVTKGDKTRIKAFEEKLGLNKLGPESKANFDAELEALDRDMTLATKPQEYLNRRLEIIRKYFGGSSQPTQPTAPSVPGSTPQNPIKFDWKNGKLIRVK